MRPFGKVNSTELIQQYIKSGKGREGERESFEPWYSLSPNSPRNSLVPIDNTQPKFSQTETTGISMAVAGFCTWGHLTKAHDRAQRTQPLPEALPRLSLWVPRALCPTTSQEEVTTNFNCLYLTQQKFLQRTDTLAKPPKNILQRKLSLIG